MSITKVTVYFGSGGRIRLEVYDDASNELLKNLALCIRGQDWLAEPLKVDTVTGCAFIRRSQVVAYEFMRDCDPNWPHNRKLEDRFIAN